MTSARHHPGFGSANRCVPRVRRRIRRLPRVERAPVRSDGAGSGRGSAAGSLGARLRRLSLREGWRRAGPLALPLLILAAMQWIGTLASPALYERAPLGLVFLSPRAPFLIYASSQSPLVVFVVVASIRSLLADPVNYALGRKLGPAVFQRIEDRGGMAYRVIRISERVIDRFGVLAVACRPNGAMLALAGARRLNPVATGAAAVFGTATYLTALALTADAAADPSGALLRWAGTAISPLWRQGFSSNPGLPVVAVLVATVAGGLLWWSRSRQQQAVTANVAARSASFTSARSQRLTARREPRP